MEKETKRIVMNGSQWTDEEIRILFVYTSQCPTLQEAFQKTYDETYRSMDAIRSKYYKERNRHVKVGKQTQQKKQFFSKVVETIRKFLYKLKK